ncbi:MAG: glycosyl hydrolase [Chloroflexi bacterium HGW-Chloroflexi-3]|nr:MAG: glycosyl hydrolase [Chloroflexi bacterium HGW-Chloroflexi-3]
MTSNLENLLKQMTVEEKISLLAGADMWHTTPVERLGIPSIRVSDGPNGVRGVTDNYSPTSACFPCGSALGATWNIELVERVGQALAEEVKSKSAHILLAPTVNIHRSPIAGRNFECYSEDPYLSGQMASAYIQGLQKNGVGACIKHFVCNDQEQERQSISSEVQERPLHEIYLEPFRIAIQKAKPWSLMSSYNRINGIYANANDYLLKSILKKKWGFDGIVISDWFGTYDPSTARGGLDIEMPGPARWASTEHVRDALERGLIDESDIDDKVRRILLTIERVGAFERPEFMPERADDRPEHRKLIREAAAESIVLLKNDGLLPLNPLQVKKLLVIGENAAHPQIVGGGSAHVNPHYVVSPLQAIQERVGTEIEVTYTIGCVSHRNLPAADPQLFLDKNGDPGLNFSVFDNTDLAGEPVLERKLQRTSLSWFGNESPAPGLEHFSLRMQAQFVPPESGIYTFGLQCIGCGRLLVDGVDQLSFKKYQGPEEWETARVLLDCDKGIPREIIVEYAWAGETDWRMVRLALLPPMPEDPITLAETMAREADAVLIVAGLTNEWESEGFDRVDMRLPGQQNELISRIVASNKNTVIALNAGSPLEMPWVDEVSAVLQLWYPGQEIGHALSDVIFGDVSPSGKLPTTFPVRLEDNPAFINFPGENGKVLYGEGIYVGYRYYDKKNIQPLYPFGYGLSYTNFVYSDLHFSSDKIGPDNVLQVSFDLSNTGAAAGKEVAQLYVRDLKARLPRPVKELKAFTKVFLNVGETRTITMSLDSQALAYYDPSLEAWVAEPGDFEILVCSSSRDIRLKGLVTLLEQHK